MNYSDPRFLDEASQQAGDQSDLAYRLKLMGLDPASMTPNLRPSPNVNLGPIHLSGSGVDSAALSVLQALREMPQGRGYGNAALRGFAQGAAGGRARQAVSRETFNANEQKRVEGLQSERRRAIGAHASEMANHRWQLAREAATREGRTPPKTLEQIRAEAEARARGQRDGAPLKVAVEDQPQNVDPIVEQIYSFKFDPTIGTRITKESNALRLRMAKLHPDFNWSNAVSDWNQKEQFNKTQNSQRFVAMRNSVNTVAEHLKDYENFNTQFDQAFRRLGQRGANIGIVAAARQGLLGPEATDAATALLTNRGALASELATVLAGGYVPQKEQIHEATKAVDAAWGPRQQAVAIGTIKKLIKGRVKSAQRSMPFSNGRANPYLQDVTPIDVFDETYPEWAPPGAVKVSK